MPNIKENEVSLIWENNNNFEKIKNYSDSEILFLSIQGFRVSAYVSHEPTYKKIKDEFEACGYIEEMTINYHYSEEYGDWDNWFTLRLKKASQFLNSKDYETYIIKRFVRLVNSKKFQNELSEMDAMKEDN